MYPQAPGSVFPSLQLQQGFPRPKLLESTEGQGGDESPATLQKGTDVGATYMCFYNPRLFCNVCSHIRINKQAVTLPVDALNALLHSKHGNELVTWKVLSLTWAVHVQRGKKSQSHKYNNLCRNLSLSLSPSIMMKYRLDFFFFFSLRQNRITVSSHVKNTERSILYPS